MCLHDLLEILYFRQIPEVQANLEYPEDPAHLAGHLFLQDPVITTISVTVSRLKGNMECDFLSTGN